MFLIVDDDKLKRSRVLRDTLAAYELPVIIATASQICDYPEALAIVVFADSEAYLNIVSLRCGRIPLLAVNASGSRIYNKDVLFYNPRAYGSHAEFVLDFIKRRFGIAPPIYKVRNLIVNGSEVNMDIVRFKLTASERRILILLMICRDRWVSERSISRACFTSCKKSCRVAVHICNLNKKVRGYIGQRLVKTKRGSGYMLESLI